MRNMKVIQENIEKIDLLWFYKSKSLKTLFCKICKKEQNGFSVPSRM